MANRGVFSPSQPWRFMELEIGQKIVHGTSLPRRHKSAVHQKRAHSGVEIRPMSVRSGLGYIALKIGDKSVGRQLRTINTLQPTGMVPLWVPNRQAFLATRDNRPMHRLAAEAERRAANDNKINNQYQSTPNSCIPPHPIPTLPRTASKSLCRTFSGSGSHAQIDSCSWHDCACLPLS